MRKLNDKGDETQNLTIKRRKLNMKKIFPNKVLTSLVLILSICFGMLPFMSLTASAEDSLSGAIDCCESCAAENESLDFVFSASESNAEILHIESSSEEIIASIKSNSPFAIRGTVEKDGKVTDANEYFDFSSVSRFDIAAWASRENYISEAEKIDCYCDLYISRNFENIDCLSSVVYEIETYRDTNFVSEAMNKKIDAIFEIPFEDGIEMYERVGSRAIPDGLNDCTYTTNNFNVHFDRTIISSIVAGEVANFFEEIRTDFINAGYNTAILEPDKEQYQIYLDPNPYDLVSSYAAANFGNNHSGSTCSSYIVFYNFGSDTTVNQWMKEIICHEYFHAIQNAYNYHANWFKEACANWAKINFVGTSTSFNLRIKAFMQSYLPIASTTDSVQYGATLYPLTIERDFGGENTIRKIYEAFSEYSPTLTDAQFRNVVTLGIQAAGYGGNFASAYRKMTIYNCNPGYWYSSVYSNATVWNEYVNDVNFSISSETIGTKSDSLSSFQSDCYKIILPSTFEGKLTFNVTFNSGTGHMQLYYTDGRAHGSSLCATTSATQTIKELNNCQYYTIINVIISNTGTTSANYSLTVTPTENT